MMAGLLMASILGIIGIIFGIGYIIGEYEKRIKSK